MMFMERTHDETPGWCWYLGRVIRGRMWMGHLSVGPPIWWRPSLGRKRYNGITEWRVGWLVIAVQIATRRAALTDPETETDRSEASDG